MSEPVHDAERPERPPSLTDRVLDLLVFAPTGAVLSALEDVPGMAARGRALIEQEVRNAHLVGRFTVGEGQRRLKRGIGLLGGGATGAPGSRAGEAAGEAPVPAPTPGPPASQEGPAPPGDGVPGAPSSAEPPTGPVAALDAASDVDLAIPGYDTLSASQVVRRLDGLGPDELAAVFRHESATRGRRTILHRVQQLLGQSDQRPPAGT